MERTLTIKVIFSAKLGYAATDTQKDPWWGLPESSQKNEALLQFSLGARVVISRVTIFFRHDFNSFSSYRQAQFMGMGYLF